MYYCQEGAAHRGADSAHKRREHTHEMAQELHQQGEGARRVGDQNKQEVYTMTERMIFALFPVLGNGFFIM